MVCIATVHQKPQRLQEDCLMKYASVLNNLCLNYRHAYAVCEMILQERRLVRL